MHVFGDRSEKNLSECHPLLQKVFREAIKRTEQDFTIIEGHRPRSEQEAAYRAGKSKARFPNSAHNQSPSCALDVIPYPFKGWSDRDIHKELKAIARVVLATAADLGIAVRWGGNWSATSVDAPGTKFVDSPHFELHPWRDHAG